MVFEDTIFECLFIFFCFQTPPKRRTTAKFGTQTRDDHVQDFCWFFVYRGRCYQRITFLNKNTWM